MQLGEPTFVLKSFIRKYVKWGVGGEEALSFALCVFICNVHAYIKKRNG